MGEERGAGWLATTDIVSCDDAGRGEDLTGISGRANCALDGLATGADSCRLRSISRRSGETNRGIPECRESSTSSDPGFVAIIISKTNR